MEQGGMMAQTTPGAAVPPRLGPWTLVSRVGSGGMGVVYQAHRPDLGERVVALKVIRPGLLDDRDVQLRFAREVEVLRRVRDVHISEFIDADIAGEPAWLATAFIEGPNLRDYVSTHGPLSRARWWEVAHGLAQALAVLEVHGITHRDMKPANVILSPNGPVLIDFGIAVPEDAASLTGTGLVTGSPAWLSPEQANLQHVTPASDIFSLGSLLAFAGTGRPPFGTGANVAVLLSIATREPDTHGLSEEQRNLLRAMMAKDPAMRPSARQVLAWSKNAGADIPADAGPAVDKYSQTAVAAPASPDATAQMQATAVAPQASTQPLVPVAQATPGASESATADQPVVHAADDERSRSWLPLLLVLLIAAVGAGIWWAVEGGSGEPTDQPTASAPASPTPGPTPPAPAQGQVARSGDFVLSPWRINNDSTGAMSVTATVKNTGAAPASGYATVYVYSDGVAIGSASTDLPEIAPGASAQVTFPSSDPWKPGEKSVTFVVQQ